MILRSVVSSFERARQTNFAMPPVADVSFGFQRSGADQNRHARIKFIGSNSDAAAFKRLDGFSDDPCDFQPTHVAERQEQLIDV